MEPCGQTNTRRTHGYPWKIGCLKWIKMGKVITVLLAGLMVDYMLLNTLLTEKDGQKKTNYVNG